MTTFYPRLVLACSLALTATFAFAQSGQITYPASDILAQTGDSSTSTFRVINSSNTELFRVTATGSVGVGTTPATKFHFFENADVNTVLQVENPNAGQSAAGALRAKSDVALINLVAHGSGRTLSRWGLSSPPGLGGWTEILHVTGNGLAFGTLNSAPIIFGTSGANRMQIAATGEIAMGAAPVAGTHLLVSDNVDAPANLQLQNLSSGTSAAAFIRAASDTAQVNFSAHSSNRTTSVPRWTGSIGGWAEILQWAGNGLAIGSLGQAPLILGTNSVSRMTFGASGGISMAGPVTVAGTLTATQVIGATYQDVAEWVDSGERLAPGTVVVVARDQVNHVVASTKSYDTRVAGVVSETPGVILGVAGEAKSMIATSGRVRVHVDASTAPIEVGDLLVTSGKAGMAMKSIPANLNGIEMHRPGTLVGKALESLPSGEGDILVLLSLQ